MPLEALRLGDDRLDLAGEHRARLGANFPEPFDEVDGLGELKRLERVQPHGATRGGELFIGALLEN